MKVLIYDPALCCSTGLCGPEPDPVQLNVNETILMLLKQGVSVERFNLAKQMGEFLSNIEVSVLLRSNGKDVLPITIVNGKVIKTRSYASYQELCAALGLKPLKGTVKFLKQD
ncbi:MAG: arsenite efflux transporter metallochaperone ArsD [Elusimicrobiota bacterium]|nr:arsenite efflux transporter metallochaperone ArsD [Elusimicrobiota bacterium]